MYTYEFQCFKCNRSLVIEIHNELGYNYKCVCKSDMTLMFYLYSPDTRA